MHYPSDETTVETTNATEASLEVATPWAQAALAGEVTKVRSAPEGARNSTLNKAAFAMGQVVAGGHLHDAEVRAALRSAAEAAGLATREIDATIRSGMEAGLKQPRGPRAHFVSASSGEPTPLVTQRALPMPYPVDALGGHLAEAAHAISDIVVCPRELAAQSVLAAAALGVQGHHDAAHPLGHSAPCSLLLITVAESGERKSTADALATAPVRSHEREMSEDYRARYAEWVNRHEAWKASRDKAKRAGKGTRTPEDIEADLRKLGPEPREPIHYARILSDPNYEGLVKHMARGHGSLAWFNNEAGQSIGGTAMSEENKLKFGSGLSKLWDGQALDRIRAGEMATSLPGRRVTTHLMVQPDIARPFLSDPILRSQGWLSRALVAEPISLIGTRQFREPDERDREKLRPYYARLHALLDAPCPYDLRPNELAPPPLPWSAAARSAWIDFYNEIEMMLGEDGDLAEHRGFGAKLAENVFRIATVLAAFHEKTEVDREVMLRAIELGRWYAAEAVRQRDSAAVSDELLQAEKARALLTDPARWHKDTVSVREFMQFGPRPARRHKNAAMDVITMLVKYGWLLPVEGSGGIFRIRGRK